MQAQILNPLLQLQRELGISDLFITHRSGVVEYIADDVIVMRGGRIKQSGPADAVLGRPLSETTRTLLAAVPRVVAAQAA